jgi:hypothetical protein
MCGGSPGSQVRAWVSQANGGVSPSSADDMDLLPSLKDSCGVDVSQIRRQLRMSVEDRVRHMVEVTNKLMEVRATVRLLDPPRVK